MRHAIATVGLFGLYAAIYGIGHEFPIMAVVGSAINGIALGLFWVVVGRHEP